MTPQQLTLDLGHRPALGREDFLIAPCNEAAVAWIDRWPDWPGPALLLAGPEGSGKTHLASVWQARSGARTIEGTALDEDELTALSRAKAGEAGSAVVLDISRAPADEQALFHLLNLSRERGLWLLILSRVPAIDLNVSLPDLASRLRALPAAHIDLPDDDLLGALLQKLFHDRQLENVSEVINYLLPRMERSFEAANRLVARLDEEALKQGSRINLRLARAVLAEIDEAGRGES